MALGVGQQATAPVHRPAERVDGPAEVVDGLAVLRSQRVSARIHSRQARRMRARVGGEDVAAEVEGAGFAGPDDGRQRAAACGGKEHAADTAEETPPRRPLSE
jgi:hypothetical protein